MRLPKASRSSRTPVRPSPQAFQLAQDATGQRLADLRHLRIVLQHLARDVERQVLAVDHAAHETQIGRRQVGVVGDVDAAHIELHAALAGRIEHVERPARGSKQQHRVGDPALGAVMQRHRGLVECAGDGAIGLGIVLGLELGLRPLPERARRVDLAGLSLLVLELDRKLDMLRIGPDDALDLVGFEKAFGVGLEVEKDLGAAPHARGLLLDPPARSRSIAPGGAPDEGLACTGAAAGHLDPMATMKAE